MVSDLLAQLRSTRGGKRQDWLVMQQSLARLDARVLQAVKVAAVPHWFDASFLSTLLDEEGRGSTADLVVELSRLSFVETFPDLGLNIHERSRTLLLEQLWQEDSSSFIELSRRAQFYCSRQDQNEAVWRIELIYHCLTAEPLRGLELFKNQVNKWKEERRDDKVEILVRTALEVVESKRMPSEAAQAIEYAYAGLGLVYGSKDSKSASDLQLVRRYLSGDAEAVATVDSWISRAAWPYQRRLADRWDDVLQDIRLEITRLLAHGHFKGESSLRTYLWRIVHHSCLDQIRSQRKASWAELVENPADPNSVVGRYINQETEDLVQESKDMLVRVLERAPQECREIWKMLVLGLSYREMSERLGVAEGTIRARVLRCRERAIEARRTLLAQSDTRAADRTGKVQSNSKPTN